MTIQEAQNNANEMVRAAMSSTEEKDWKDVQHLADLNYAFRKSDFEMLDKILDHYEQENK